jgi:hypothetical protein
MKTTIRKKEKKLIENINYGDDQDNIMKYCDQLIIILLSVVQIIGHTLKRQQNFQGLSKGHRNTDNLIPTGLLLDPRTKALVLNGKPGHLQFYLMNLEKHLYNVRNRVQKI